MPIYDFKCKKCGKVTEFFIRSMVSSIVEELAKDYAGKLKVCKLNVDDIPSLAQMYNIMSIPTLTIFKDGKAVDEIIGALPKGVIEEKIKPHIQE